jgi:osmoprotectant transport system ATP-binding protein
MIEFESVSMSYGDRVVLDGLSFAVAEGELVALLGASGCGKTTTLKLVNRLLEPSAGTVRVRGKSVQESDPIALRRSIGYVFQQFGLFPHMNVQQNIAVVPRLLGWDEARVQARVRVLSVLVGLDEGSLLGRFPDELSGGQRQRVGLARALAAEPRVMLMDEPFGALDPVTRDALQVEYARLRRELGLTTLLVTHDMTEALLLADRIAVIDQGKIVQLGSPKTLLSEPASPLITELLRMPQRQLQRLSELGR